MPKKKPTVQQSIAQMEKTRPLRAIQAAEQFRAIVGTFKIWGEEQRRNLAAGLHMDITYEEVVEMFAALDLPEQYKGDRSMEQHARAMEKVMRDRLVPICIEDASVFSDEPCKPLPDSSEDSERRIANEVWICEDLGDAIATMIDGWSGLMTITEVPYGNLDEFWNIAQGMMDGYREQHADLEGHATMQGTVQRLLQVNVADNVNGMLIPLGFVALCWENRAEASRTLASHVYASYVRKPYWRY